MVEVKITYISAKTKISSKVKITYTTNWPLYNHSHLTHSFPIHPFLTPWKHQKTFRFSDVFRRERKGALGTNRLSKMSKLNDSLHKNVQRDWWCLTCKRNTLIWKNKQLQLDFLLKQDWFKFIYRKEELNTDIQI